jgi:hypothetical protein
MRTTCLAQLIFLDMHTKLLRDKIVTVRLEVLPIHLRVHLSV